MSKFKRQMRIDYGFGAKEQQEKMFHTHDSLSNASVLSVSWLHLLYVTVVNWSSLWC